MPGKLYKISQDPNDGYDTYDSAVVCAESPDDAKLIFPGSSADVVWGEDCDGNWAWITDGDYSSLDNYWAPPYKIIAEFIGIAADDIKVGTVIVASFHAG